MKCLKTAETDSVVTSDELLDKMQRNKQNALVLRKETILCSDYLVACCVCCVICGKWACLVAWNAPNHVCGQHLSVRATPPLTWCTCVLRQLQHIVVTLYCACAVSPGVYWSSPIVYYSACFFSLRPKQSEELLLCISAWSYQSSVIIPLLLSSSIQPAIVETLWIKKEIDERNETRLLNDISRLDPLYGRADRAAPPFTDSGALGITNWNVLWAPETVLYVSHEFMKICGFTKNNQLIH